MTTLTAPPETTRRRSGLMGQLRERGVYLAVAALFVFNLVFTANFATPDTLRLQLIQAVPIIIVALGMALVIGTEGIDLSVGAIMALAAAVIPLYLGYGVLPAIGMALLVGIGVGLLNGLMVAVVGLQPIIATLAVLVGGRGLALVMADGKLTELFDPTLSALGYGKVFGVPLAVLLTVVLVIMVGFVMRRTLLGRQLVAVGGNRKASLLAGVPVRRTLFAVYALSGLLAAIAGVVLTARTGAANPAYIGLEFELFAITAVVVGGTPLTGGRVRILGTVMGAMLMQLVSTTLVSHNLMDSDRRIVTALIIIGAVALHQARRRSS
ncbi:MAG: ATPase [Actinobacteria bacterium HGW-Actinobacteria-4]|nr:MAG: ATPase [Actinobacteria bacterium HGW-Actinobacteria-4]